jgi:hypothetical protein
MPLEGVFKGAIFLLLGGVASRVHASFMLAAHPNQGESLFEDLTRPLPLAPSGLHAAHIAVPLWHSQRDSTSPPSGKAVAAREPCAASGTPGGSGGSGTSPAAPVQRQQDPLPPFDCDCHPMPAPPAQPPTSSAAITGGTKRSAQVQQQHQQQEGGSQEDGGRAPKRSRLGASARSCSLVGEDPLPGQRPSTCSPASPGEGGQASLGADAAMAGAAGSSSSGKGQGPTQDSGEGPVVSGARGAERPSSSTGGRGEQVRGAAPGAATAHPSATPGPERCGGASLPAADAAAGATPYFLGVSGFGAAGCGGTGGRTGDWDRSPFASTPLGGWRPTPGESIDWGFCSFESGRR